MKKIEFKFLRKSNFSFLKGKEIFSLKKIGVKLSILFGVLVILTTLSCTIFGVYQLNVVNKQYLQIGNAGMKALSEGLNSSEKLSKTCGYFLSNNKTFLDAFNNQDIDAMTNEATNVAKFGNVDFVTIVDKNGFLVAKNYTNNVSQNLTDISHIKNALAGKETTCIETTFASSLGTFTGIPIKNDKGEVIGAISIGSDYTNPKILDSLKKTTGYEYTIALDDQRVNTTLLNADGSRYLNTNLPTIVKETVLDKGKSYEGVTKLLNKYYGAAYMPLKNSDGSVIGAIFTGVPLDSEVRKNNLTTAAAAVGCLLIFILSLSLALFYIKKRISDPIKKVTKLANGITNGDLGINNGESIHLGIKTKDEIGNLANALESSTEMLKSYMGDMDRVLREMANGDFTVKPEIEYQGDFVGIKNSLEFVSQSLNKLISEVNISAEQVSSSSEQIASGAQVLSQGATEQASEIEELSSLINDITGKISINAEHATAVSQLTNDSLKLSVESKNGMEKLQEAMSEIQRDTMEMKRVVKTIDDFAFQTNVLALNAAVEAARAGSYGRGFAVVADEVRNLAIKSAAAANETDELIEKAVDVVEKGVAYVKGTSEACDKVVNMSTQIDEKVDQMAIASNEQANSAAQITVAVDEISKVIQTDSSTAEQSAAASEELTGLAQNLQTLVEKFKISDETIKNDDFSIKTDHHESFVPEKTEREMCKYL